MENLQSGKNASAETRQRAVEPCLSAEERFRRAAALHESGYLGEAEREYRLALASERAHFGSLFNLGMLCVQQGRADEGEAWLRQAVAADKTSSEAMNCLGSLLQARWRHEEALAYHRRAIDLDPQFCEAHYDLATALLSLGRPDEAAALYRSALAIDADWPEAHYNLAVALQAEGRSDEAVSSYRRAIALRADYARAYDGLGVALVAQDRVEEGLASIDRALAIKPNDPGALNNRGNALRRLKRFDEALISYDRVLAIEPNRAEALNNRGNILLDLRRIEGALASFDRALAVSPESVEALSNRGDALALLNRYEEAAADYQRLLRAAPDFDYAKGKLLFCRLNSCDWRDYDASAAAIRTDVMAGKRASYPFGFTAASDSPAALRRCAETYGKDKWPAAAQGLWQGERYHHNRIRVAYVSADLRNHAVAHLMAELFETHDKARFETTAISLGADTRDDMRIRLERAFGRFIDVRARNDRDVAHLMKNMEIDIAVDLNGYTQDCRPGLFALRPAPIQVSFLGYPGTMGTTYMDYILADRVIVPEDHQPFYSEKIVYLPDTYQPTDTKRRISEHTPTRAEAGLPDTGFVFCCFNNGYKILPPVFEVWMSLLRQVEGSVLWLLGGAPMMRNLRQEAERRGVAPERLVFAPRVKMGDHLARHRLAGLFLDTLPYNAHTTASDALWTGLPVLTCRGSSFAGRVAASLLTAVGLPELITDTLDAYGELALRLARDEALLGTVRAKLARHRETFPLFDANRFRTHIETAYRTMWERHQRGEAPASFAVPPAAFA